MLSTKDEKKNVQIVQKWYKIDLRKSNETQKSPLPDLVVVRGDHDSLNSSTTNNVPRLFVTSGCSSVSNVGVDGSACNDRYRRRKVVVHVELSDKYFEECSENNLESNTEKTSKAVQTSPTMQLRWKRKNK